MGSRNRHAKREVSDPFHVSERFEKRRSPPFLRNGKEKRGRRGNHPCHGRGRGGIASIAVLPSKGKKKKKRISGEV